MANGERSFWGWGLASRFPDRATRKQLGGTLKSLAGLEPTTLIDPPSPDALRLPASRIQAPKNLASRCSFEPQVRASHCFGKSYPDIVRGIRGEFAGAPDIVALPESESDIAELIDWCGDAEVALIPYGGGSSVVGGVEADVPKHYKGVVTCDLQGLDRVLEVDTTSRAARIQAGARGPVLNAQLAEHGLQLRHYPQSYEYSTLGGWIATRAGGHYATLYTHIDDLIESVRLLTPRGVMETRRLPASGAGPDANRWVCGSEGTLGLITEAWVRVQQKPRRRGSASVELPSFERGVAAVRAISQASLYPTNCRLLQASEAHLNGIAVGGEAVLLLGFESSEQDVAPALQHAIQLAEREGGTCKSGARLRDASEERVVDDASAGWRQAFFDAPYLRDVLVSLGVIVDTFETACTWDRFDALRGAITAAVTDAMQDACGGGVLTCRFTHVYPDGPAPYFTFLAPARPGAELEQWTRIKEAASRAIVENGGTITHHHAVGRVHLPWYEREQAPLFAEALRAVKKTWDPAGILNPGVLLSP